MRQSQRAEKANSCCTLLGRPRLRRYVVAVVLALVAAVLVALPAPMALFRLCCILFISGWAVTSVMCKHSGSRIRCRDRQPIA